MPIPVWNEVTAVFGGRFDPPHLGHRQAARGLFQNPGIQRVIVVPSASPPQKPAIASAHDRALMAERNFHSNGTQGESHPIEVNRIELERQEKAPGTPSFTFYTLQALRTQCPKLAFALGADQLHGLPTWHRFPEILTLCHWIVLERKPQGHELIQKTLQEWKASGLIAATPQPDTWEVRGTPHVIRSVPTEATGLSSTTIRQSILKTGAPPANSLHPQVEAYLKLHPNYGISHAHDSR